jgi:LacI family transcriptional regulator, galactose operon repressor
MAKRVTVYDIAGKVGLSASTVSRVLNNSILISDEKRDLILSAAAELGYTKRPIRKQRSRAILNIALFLPRLKERHLHLFYEITELISTIREVFGETRVNIITDVTDRAPEHLSSKKVGGIDGAIFAFSYPHPRTAELFSDLEIPFAVLNRRGAGIDFVDCEHGEGTRRLVSELLRHRPGASPCYLHFPAVAVISDRRREGFLAACREGGVENCEERVVPVIQFTDLTARRLRELHREYDAFVAFNDVLAVYLYQQALSAGIRIPEEAALTGFDGSPVTGLITPGLTTMAMPVTRMVQAASSWLFRRIIERNPEGLQLTLNAEFIPGETI